LGWVFSFSLCLIIDPCLLKYTTKGESAQIINTCKAGECFTPEDKDDFLLKLNKIYIKSNQEHNCYLEGLGNLAQDFNRRSLAHKMLNTIKFIT